MKFKYRAINSSGEVIEDLCFAKDRDEVIDMIKSKGLLCLAIEENFQINASDFFKNKKAGLKDLVVFCKLFYTMLKAGIKISKSLEIITKNINNSKLKSSVININKDIHKGLSLSDSLENQNKVFPPLFIEMVRAGEISGNLEEIIYRLGQYYENQYKIKNKIKSSLVYPILLILVSIAVVIFILTFVLPVFFNMFTNRGLTLPLPTRILITISDTILQEWSKLIILFSISIIVIKIFLKTNRGQVALDFLKLNTPFLKKLYINIITANFSKTLSILLSSGVPLIKSLEMTGNVLNNCLVKNKLYYETNQVEAGKQLSNSIRDLKIFPPLLDSMIQVGEETGELDEMLLTTSEFYDEELGSSLEKLTKLIEPILMIIIGLIVGFIVVSLALPMFEIMYTV